MEADGYRTMTYISATPSENTMTDQARLRRLRYRAWRRGFKEIDLIIGHFVDNEAMTLSEGELDQLEELMSEQDQDLYGYIIGTVETPPELELPVLQRLRDMSRLAGQIEASSTAKGFGE